MGNCMCVLRVFNSPVTVTWQRKVSHQKNKVTSPCYLIVQSNDVNQSIENKNIAYMKLPADSHIGLRLSACNLKLD